MRSVATVRVHRDFELCEGTLGTVQDSRAGWIILNWARMGPDIIDHHLSLVIGGRFEW